MVTLISNPTISFPVSIPRVRAISSSSNLQISNCSISSEKLLFRFRNWRKSSGVRIGVSTTRKSVISCGVTKINQTQFSEAVLKSDTPVLVEFGATWCGPCLLLSPRVESAAENYKDKLKVFKIDHDANPQLIEEYKVSGLPTLILFKDGQEVPESRREGAMTEEKLKEYLDGLLESKAMT